jgi:alanine racemase
LKADAYGHGALRMAAWLAEAGVEAFGVATVDEGWELRKAGFDQPTLLFGSLQPEEIAGAVEARLDVFVWTKEDVARLSEASRGRGTLRVHLKIDTGMGRVGCRPEETEKIAESIVHSLPLELTGICTHFASSDSPGPVTVPEQLARFQTSLDALKARGWTPRFIHAANSGGVISWPQSHFNLVRPGILLYGYPPPTVSDDGFLPVMELVSKVGWVKTVPAGTTLSYGSRYTTSQTTDVATIPLGYADGYRRAFTNRAPVWIADRLFRVSGTVCMDQFLVDLGPNSGIKTGDPVVLFGPSSPEKTASPPTAADLATIADTISYELLCGVSARVPRVSV